MIPPAKRTRLELPDELYRRVAHEYDDGGGIAHALVQTASRFRTMPELLGKATMYTLEHAKPDLFSGDVGGAHVNRVAGRIRGLKGKETARPLRALVARLVEAPPVVSRRGFERLLLHATEMRGREDKAAHGEFLLAAAEVDARFGLETREIHAEHLDAEIQSLSPEQKVRYIQSRVTDFGAISRHDELYWDTEFHPNNQTMARITTVLDTLEGPDRMSGTHAVLRQMQVLHQRERIVGGRIPDWYANFLDRPECKDDALLPHYLHATQGTVSFSSALHRADQLLDAHASNPEAVFPVHRAYLEVVGGDFVAGQFPRPFLECCLRSFDVFRSFPKYHDATNNEAILKTAVALLSQDALHDAERSEHLTRTLQLLHDRAHTCDLERFGSEQYGKLAVAFTRLEPDSLPEPASAFYELLGRSIYMTGSARTQIETLRILGFAIEVYALTKNEHCYDAATAMLKSLQPEHVTVEKREQTFRAVHSIMAVSPAVSVEHIGIMLDAMWDRVHASPSSTLEERTFVDACCGKLGAGIVLKEPAYLAWGREYEELRGSAVSQCRHFEHAELRGLLGALNMSSRLLARDEVDGSIPAENVGRLLNDIEVTPLGSESDEELLNEILFKFHMIHNRRTDFYTAEHVAMVNRLVLQRIGRQFERGDNVIVLIGSLKLILHSICLMDVTQEDVALQRLMRECSVPHAQARLQFFEHVVVPIFDGLPRYHHDEPLDFGWRGALLKEAMQWTAPQPAASLPRFHKLLHEAARDLPDAERRLFESE